MNRPCFDLHGDFMFSVHSMNVRHSVLAVEHADHDPEKACSSGIGVHVLRDFIAGITFEFTRSRKRAKPAVTSRVQRKVSLGAFLEPRTDCDLPT